MLLPIILLLLFALNTFLLTAFSHNFLSYQNVSTENQVFSQFKMSESVLNQAETWLKSTPLELLPNPV